MIAVAVVAHERARLRLGRRRSCSARSSRRPTRSPRRRSRAGSASPAGSSRSSRARAWSTTPPRWSPTSSRSPPWSPAASACSRRAGEFVAHRGRRHRRRASSSARSSPAIRRRIDDPPVEVTIALFTGYFAYLPAEAIGVSGVLAAVTVGIYMGRLTSRLTTPTTRIQGYAVWEIVTFLLNSALFVLVGLQLPADRRRDLRDRRRRRSLRDGAADRGDGDRDPDHVGLPVHLPAAAAVGHDPPARALPALAPHPAGRLDRDARRRLAGRGARAAADDRRRGPLSRARPDHLPAPSRSSWRRCSLQGLTLPPLIRWLGVDDYDDELEQEEINARLSAIESAMARIDELRGEDWVLEDTVDRVRGAYTYRQRRFTALRATASSTAASTATGSTTRPGRWPTSGWCASCSTRSERP